MIENLNQPHVGMFVFAWFLADLLVPVLIWIALRTGAVDRPHTYKTHEQPVAFLGGVGIFLAFSVAIFSILRFESFEGNRPLFGIVFGAAFVLVLGVIDDMRPIWAVAKLLVLFLATWLLGRFGIAATLFEQPFAWANTLLTLLWIAGVTSAMNSLDNMDGAAGGVTVLAALTTFVIAWENHAALSGGAENQYWRQVQRWVSFASIAHAGATLGFLRYNAVGPARTYLGNNGAFLTGFLLASITIMGAWSQADRVKSIIIPCVVLVVPLYDITLSTILRVKNGVVKGAVEAITYCGRDHVTHRLAALGLGKRGAVLFLYLFSAVSGCVAIYISRPSVPRAQYLPVTGAGILVLVVLGVILDRARVYESLPVSRAAGDDKGGAITGGAVV